ncbi:hypothetical protein SMSP2_00656 [Limihaloglobus sulfuriphilus]|uniref:DUF5320 domain-containing protein n=1 Tax=Limihaloglobus sulfuriphilus TaxID=1851148 RepID=A0A1Q2MDH3_9BACT|nr:DUF5320 domain-containing protein [Limihaloglobus sulfuriphilus]AQQ70312.1 hypothetical protein SMSP2_00656 [Limihaloglobus sulfuriphilus]
MPGFDRTGPMGQGPMTGRGLGLCTGAVRPGAGYGYGFGYGRGYGRGFGRGMGRGFGRGYGRGVGYYGPYPPAYAPEDYSQPEDLKAHIEELEAELQRLKALDENSDNQR